MRKLFSLSLITIFVTAAAFARAPQSGTPQSGTPQSGTPQSGASVVGSWDITIDSPNGKREGVLVIKQEGDKLTGMMKTPRGDRPLDSVTVKGSDITFVMTAQVQGQDLVMTYKGKLDKGAMSGDADFGGLATGTWSAVPHKEDAASASPPPATATAPASTITGVWQ